jgi:hypothetical protein
MLAEACQAVGVDTRKAAGNLTLVVFLLIQDPQAASIVAEST